MTKRGFYHVRCARYTGADGAARRPYHIDPLLTIKIAIAAGRSSDMLCVPRRRVRRRGKRFQLRVKQLSRMFLDDGNHNNIKLKSCVPQDAASRKRVRGETNGKLET